MRERCKTSHLKIQIAYRQSCRPGKTLKNIDQHHLLVKTGTDAAENGSNFAERWQRHDATS